MVVKTSSDEKQRKRYGSLNRNEFRREEDDDVSLDRICSKRILEDTRFAFVGIPSSGTKISHVSRDHEIVRIIIINSLSLSLGFFIPRIWVNKRDDLDFNSHGSRVSY